MMQVMMATSFETPPQQSSCYNPFDYEPRSPNASRTTIDLSRRILGNLDNLCAPTLLAPSLDAKRQSPPNSMVISARRQSPNFDAALNRMKNGTTLHRLQQERINNVIQVSREQEAIHRLQALCVEPTEKGVTNPTVQLGRQAPERRSSGMARSA
jgi:hypothetical protein